MKGDKSELYNYNHMKHVSMKATGSKTILGNLPEILGSTITSYNLQKLSWILLRHFSPSTTASDILVDNTEFFILSNPFGIVLN